MLTEMAVADAYAIAWEFTDQQRAKNDLRRFYQHPTYAELLPGQYTDDTQRSIANALVLVRPHRKDKFNPDIYAQSYLSIDRHDHREGYSRGYQAFLASVDDSQDFLVGIQRNKLSNGSVMGVAPIGWLPDIREVKVAAMMQAITTHHPSTVVHAQLVALSVHYFTHCQGDREGLVRWLLDNADFATADQAQKWHDSVEAYQDGGKTGILASSISAWMAYAVTRFSSLTEIILQSVEHGGDTDSAAAVAVAVASCCPEIKNNIPEHLITLLDTANPGFDSFFMNELEEKLRTQYRIGFDR